LYVGLCQESSSGSETVREKVMRLARDLKERLVRIERFLEETDPMKIKESDIPEILEIAISEGKPEIEMAEFLVKHKTLEVQQAQLTEAERSEIRNRIIGGTKKPSRGILIQSPHLRESVATLIERGVRDRIDCYDPHADLLRCASKVCKVKPHEKFSGIAAVERYIADGTSLIRKRWNKIFESYLDKAVDPTIDEVLYRAGFPSHQ